MKYITFLNLGIKIFFTLCVFLYIKEEEDYWIYPLLQGAGFIGAGLIGQVMLVKKYNLKFVRLKTRLIKQTITSNFPIFVNQFFPTLYNNTTTLLLGVLTNASNVGIYDAIKKIVDICITIIMILSRVFFPFLNRRKGVFPKYRNMMLVIGAAMTLLPILLYRPLFWYLNIMDLHAFSVLVALSLSVMGFALYNIFGTNYFIIQRGDKLVMRNTIKSSIFGLILAFPLIHYYGIVGAGVNLCLARWFMGGGLLIKYMKV